MTVIKIYAPTIDVEADIHELYDDVQIKIDRTRKQDVLL